jgi:hypothetical protein
MAGRDEPSQPRGQLHLLDFHLGMKRAPPDVDRAEIEAQVEARRQARLQREEAAKSAADAAKSASRQAAEAAARCPRSGAASSRGRASRAAAPVLKLHGWIKADARGTQRLRKMSVPLCVLMNGGMQIDVEMRVCRVWCRVGTSYTGG